MNKQILFTFESKKYGVDAKAAYEKSLIRLPDGRVVRVSGWLESMPPQPRVIKPHLKPVDESIPSAWER